MTDTPKNFFINSTAVSRLLMRGKSLSLMVRDIISFGGKQSKKNVSSEDAEILAFIGNSCHLK